MRRLLTGGVASIEIWVGGSAVKSHATHIIHRTPQATVDLVLKLRREKHWVPCKIEGYLRKHSEETASVSHTTIYRMLVEAELNRPIAKPRRVWVSVGSRGNTATAFGRQTSSSPAKMNGW